ncbi:MAG: hypothetical protein IPP99_00530 [Chitinophagaceae bacterium]|jgi:hypothetical protein|nr:hypothetical protein [Chitinophagaceae bacterium]MBL0335378.1 hypothetical protein [Chitinophagaceae bacterium]MBN8669001.1 hypothetical protein [Chitinophagales bacterium]
MNNPASIDRFDEMLRLIYLDQVNAMDPDHTQQELSRMINSKEVSISPANEEIIMSKLTALMQQPSLGQLIQWAMKESNVEEKLLVEKTGLTPVLISELKNDAVYPNNVPIQVFKKLVMALELSYTNVRAAVLKTFGQLKQQIGFNDTTAFGFIPAYRKGHEQLNYESVRMDSISEGNELFENEEALNKYLNRLEELMTE